MPELVLVFDAFEGWVLALLLEEDCIVLKALLQPLFYVPRIGSLMDPFLLEALLFLGLL